MTDTILRWALGFNGIIMLSLIGVIWNMRKGEIRRNEDRQRSDIARLDDVVQGIRDKKHDHEDVLAELSGTMDMLKNDADVLRRKVYVIEQVLEYMKIKEKAGETN